MVDLLCESLEQRKEAKDGIGLVADVPRRQVLYMKGTRIYQVMNVSTEVFEVENKSWFSHAKHSLRADYDFCHMDGLCSVPRIEHRTYRTEVMYSEVKHHSSMCPRAREST